MKAAASAKEIVIEEKIHIIETEELTEEEIPLPVKELSLSTKVETDGKDFMNSLSCSSLFSLVIPVTYFPPTVYKLDLLNP